MKCTIKVYPVGGEPPTVWLESWNDTHPDTPLQIVTAPDQCQAYLACDLAADVIDADVSALPSRPVIWPPFAYSSCGDFTREAPTPYEHLLRTLYGSITRAAMLQTLYEVKQALDDASSVVDAGEGEEYAYEREEGRLAKLIEQLEAGAFIMDEEVNHA